MAFYIILGPVMLLMVFMIFKLHQIKKHDSVLFRFCQLRRDIMGYLRKDFDSITKSDHNEVRMLLRLLNSTIHDYDEHKKGLFKINKFIVQAKTVYKSVNEAKRKESKNNDVIKGFYKDYGKIMLIAYLTYTPFLKSKIIIAVLTAILEFLAKYFNRYIKHHITFLEWLKGESNRLKLDSHL